MIKKLTYEEIETLSPEAIGAKIAEIMGWVVDAKGGEFCYVDPPQDRFISYTNTYLPSTNWNQIEELVIQCPDVMILKSQVCWTAVVSTHIGTGETPMLAFCRALILSKQ